MTIDQAVEKIDRVYHRGCEYWQQATALERAGKNTEALPIRRRGDRLFTAATTAYSKLCDVHGFVAVLTRGRS